MIVTINGKEEMVESGFTPGSFLKSKGLDYESVVVELNRTIINQADYDRIELKEKDILEILRFVGGG